MQATVCADVKVKEVGVLLIFTIQIGSPGVPSVNKEASQSCPDVLTGLLSA